MPAGFFAAVFFAGAFAFAAGFFFGADFFAGVFFFAAMERALNPRGATGKEVWSGRGLQKRNRLWPARTSQKRALRRRRHGDARRSDETGCSSPACSATSRAGERTCGRL
ncbi:MAG: hypothetical protein DI536_30040 [Archangium gephyra]|uniref:Uncharacterized protein n=1 Tax=Archangium gephyra TaxID=48 RepID=A0A2W5SUM8_9BACT|nr:MAG: hypothetical protein DI536_30040 [Archangium gephyra]